jgi:AraC-like DNA-binding protein
MRNFQIEPLLFKARGLIQSYEAATGAAAAVISREGHVLAGTSLAGSDGLRAHALANAYASGGVSIYSQEPDSICWTCPILLNGWLAGGLAACKADGVESPEIEAMAQLLLSCGVQVSKDNQSYHHKLRRQIAQQENLMAEIDTLREASAQAQPPPEAYSFDKEKCLIEAVKKGDEPQAVQALKELTARIIFIRGADINFFRFRVIEILALLDQSSENLLKTLKTCTSFDELADILYLAVERGVRHAASFTGLRHAAAMRKAERYIRDNYTRKISLKEIAAISGLSAPYFSSVFKEEMGENLSSYLNRLRVNRAAGLLRETNLPLSDIAGCCGFEDQSWFSKIFKSYTGRSPGKFRERRLVVQHLASHHQAQRRA